MSDFVLHAAKQNEYVLELIATTVTRDLPDELQTLVQIDQAATAIKEIVDLPDPKLSLHGTGKAVRSSKTVTLHPARPRRGRKPLSIVKRCACATCAAAPTQRSFFP